MVENELPLASVNVQSSSTFDKRSLSSSKNLADSQDINEIEVISEHENNLNNGSSTDHMYYREKSNSSIHNVEVEKKTGDSLQNVYSNIPSASSSKSTSNVPNILKNAAADHVYSNIDETVAVNGNSAGARFLSDNLDLDLDDPLLTSSFIKKKEIPNNQQQNIYNTSASSHGGAGALPNDSQSSKNNLPSISSSSSTNGTQVTSIELKNVLNAVALQKSNHQVTEPSLPIGPTLRQETMIDTALDLDSLDDGSQVGLMKTL